MNPPIPFRDLVALVAERIRTAVQTLEQDSPVRRTGRTIAEWKEAVTVSELTPDEADATNATAMALQKLSRNGVLDWLAGLPPRYRPMARP